VEDRILEIKDKIDINEKTDESLEKRFRAMKGTNKNTAIPLKDQTCES
jgi:vesicle coat complex subunit